MIHDKPMPSNEAAEKCVIGAVLISGAEAFYEAAEVINANDFYNDKHRLIWNMLIEFIGKNLPLDIATLKEKMPNFEEIGGMAYLISLYNSVNTAENIKHHAEIVKQKSLARQGIKLCINTIGNLYEKEEVKEIIAKTITGYSNLLSEGTKSEIVHVKDIAGEVYNDICARMEAKDIVGLKTGIVDFDNKIGGLEDGNFIILAARTSQGKTTFALNIADYVAQTADVLFFSLEMGKKKLLEKIFSKKASVPGNLLQNSRDMTTNHVKRINMAVSDIEKTRLFIDDTSGLKLSDIIIKTRRFLATHPGLKLIIIDYLQIMKSDIKADMRERINENCTGLRDFAKEIKVPIICLSQISRGVESREDKRPGLADLKESGKQEEDADIVIFLYREDYYKDKGNDPSLTEVIIAKNRNGQVGTIKVMFHKSISRFTEVSHE